MMQEINMAESTDATQRSEWQCLTSTRIVTLRQMPVSQFVCTWHCT